MGGDLLRRWNVDCLPGARLAWREAGPETYEVQAVPNSRTPGHHNGSPPEAPEAERRGALDEGDRWPARWGSLLFDSENGTPINPSNLRRLIGRFAQDAGIDGVLNPYDLWHTATSLISAAGLSAERLADLLGDKDTRMVFGHYRHPVTSSVSVAAEYWGANQGANWPTEAARENQAVIRGDGSESR